MRIVALIMLAMAPLAGCADAVDGPAGAAAWLDMATDAARDVDPGARLLGIAGLEAAEPQDVLAGQPRPAWVDAWAVADDGPVDGRLPAWLYAFLGDGDPVYVVAVRGDVAFAARVGEEEAMQGLVRLRAPGAWSVDAPAAFTALSDAGAAPSAPVVWQLAGDEDGPPAWRAASLDGGEGEEDGALVARAELEVDAGTGEVRPVMEDEAGEVFRETLDVTAPEVAHGFEPGDEAVRGHVVLLDPLPGTIVEFRLVEPGGVEHVALVADEATLEVPGRPGTWTISASLVRGVQVELEMAWCPVEDDGGAPRR